MKSNQKGLTLIEVLISVALLSAGAVFVLQALARVAQVQTAVDRGIEFYMFSASQMAEVESALFQPGGRAGMTRTKGSFKNDENQLSKWELSFEPYDESRGLELVYYRMLMNAGPNEEKMAIYTLAQIPPVEGAL